jgi:hypothetical protein
MGMVMAYCAAPCGRVAELSGLAVDAAFSREGFERVLSIRAEMEGMWGGVPPAPERYLDLTTYEQARAAA